MPKAFDRVYICVKGSRIFGIDILFYVSIGIVEIKTENVSC